MRANSKIPWHQFRDYLILIVFLLGVLALDDINEKVFSALPHQEVQP